jgi:arginine/ornithine N-succinyltransferase beta subunit
MTKLFTAIFVDSLIMGSHRSSITKMRRIQRNEDETVKQMLEREDLYNGNLVFLFNGHPTMEGENENE